MFGGKLRLSVLGQSDLLGFEPGGR